MIKIFLFSIFIFSHSFIKAQDLIGAKSSFEIKSFPTYDANGNYYSFTKHYYYLPTKEDSVLFKIEMEETFRPIMDSVEREIEIQDKINAEMNRLYNEQNKNPKQYASLYPRVGKHLFAFHWISWEKFGSVNIKKINLKKYSIKGSQKDDNGNYVTIDGFLIPVEKGKLTFIGEIVTKFWAIIMAKHV
jgi:hypothetical protein